MTETPEEFQTHQASVMAKAFIMMALGIQHFVPNHLRFLISPCKLVTLRLSGAMGWPTACYKDCSARVRDSGALELLKEAAGLLKDLNGEDDKSLGLDHCYGCCGDCGCV